MHVGPPYHLTNIYMARMSRHQQLSIDTCCPHRPSAANPPAAAALSRYGQTDTQPFINQSINLLLYGSLKPGFQYNYMQWMPLTTVHVGPSATVSHTSGRWSRSTTIAAAAVAWVSGCSDGGHSATGIHWRCQPHTTQKGKGSPYSTAERRVPELISVLGSQPAGDVSHKPGTRLPLLSTRPVVTLATLNRAATNFAAWWTGTMGVNILPKTVTRQRRGCDLVHLGTAALWLMCAAF